MTMVDPLDLIRRLADEERRLVGRELVAPHFPRAARVRVRVQGLIYEFKIGPRPAVGLGVFRAASRAHAEFVREASPEQAEEYLGCFPRVRAVTAVEADGGWHALPADAAAGRRAGFAGLVPVVELEGYARDRVAGAFEWLEGAYDGARVWLRHLDPRADVAKQDGLRRCLARADREAALAVKGLVAEDRAAVELAFRARGETERVVLESRVHSVLAARGGAVEALRSFPDGRVEVRWRSQSGREYTTLVRREDLSVVSAGICLSAEDARFDLGSLVGVVHEGEGARQIVEMDIDEARGLHPEAEEEAL